MNAKFLRLLLALILKLYMTVIINERLASKTGLKVIQNGPYIETYNKYGDIIHRIEPYDHEHKIFRHSLIGVVQDDEIVEVFEGVLLQKFKESGCRKVCVNHSKHEGSLDGVNQWLVDKYLPKVIGMGLKYHAIVLAEEVFANLSFDPFTENSSEIFHNRCFASVKEAYAWLTSVL